MRPHNAGEIDAATRELEDVEAGALDREAGGRSRDVSKLMACKRSSRQRVVRRLSSAPRFDLGDERRDAADRGGVDQQDGMALVLDHIGLRVGMAALHLRQRLRRQQI